MDTNSSHFCHERTDTHKWMNEWEPSMYGRLMIFFFLKEIYGGPCCCCFDDGSAGGVIYCCLFLGIAIQRLPTIGFSIKPISLFWTFHVWNGNLDIHLYLEYIHTQFKEIRFFRCGFYKDITWLFMRNYVLIGFYRI